jgi:hypothetical protein
MFMSKAKTKFRRPLTVLFSSVCCAAAAFPLLAADGDASAPTKAIPVSGARAGHPQSALVNLIIRLRESGTLKPDEAAELIKLAEADAADARVQAALVALANAQAEAAQTRAEALALQAAAGKNMQARGVVDNTNISPAAPAPVAMAAPAVIPAVVDTAATTASAPVAAARPVAQPESAAPIRSPAAPQQPAQDDDTVRVTYVPEVVKAQLREEIKNDVMEQARTEHWAAPRSFPDWVSRFTFYGDVRLRYEAIYNHKQNTNNGDFYAFPNFNAVNTGSPYNTADTSVAFPRYNIDQDRARLRLRARLGAAVDLGEGFTSNFRMATGENNSPVSENQSFGAAGSGQGGGFSKYSLWLDRAYLKYQTTSDPARALTATLGRFDNPFLGTSIIWADDLGFDGAVLTIPAQIHFDGQVIDSVRPFAVIGAFPVFNTDLNFSSNSNTKFKSNDKWLEAAQLGLDLKISRDLNVKLGTAYYLFTKTVGKTYTYTPYSSSDGGETDSRRPAFAQKGNTYMALRDIIPAYDDKGNLLGQWQYFGLATAFHDVAFDVRADYNHFDPFQISFIGEYVENQAFSARNVIARGAVNNLGDSGDTSVGGGSAWIVGIKLGDALLQKRWDWNVSLNYREVDSDAVIDGFCDSDFGGGGTNLKGLTLGANLALAKRVSVGAKWMSASEVSGQPFRNDILQFDINGKF